VLVVGVRDPPIKLSIGLAENTRKRLRRNSFNRRIGDECRHRRQAVEHTRNFGG